MKYIELPGEPDTTSEAETMAMIRSVLTDDSPKQRNFKLRRSRVNTIDTKDGLPSHAADLAEIPRPAETIPQLTEATPPKPKPAQRLDAIFPELDAPTDTPQHYTKSRIKVERSQQAQKTQIKRATGFQPKTRHVAALCVALLLVIRPAWVLIAACAGILAFVIALMTVGGDSLWHKVLAWLDRVENRDPQRAARLRTKLDQMACRWDVFLDRLPENLADNLAMPDFQAMQHAETAHNAAVGDRLNRMVKHG